VAPPSSPPRSRASRSGATLLAHAALIAVITFIAYGDSFDGRFVSDDTVSVQEKVAIRGLDWEHLRLMFTTFDDANYIPVKVLSIALDYRLWGLDPTGYHLTNLLIHIACALLVYALLLRLGLPPVAACLTALLWAVHPLQVESVAWISERKNVLSGLFFFAAFYVYLGFSEAGGPGRYAWVLLLYTLALLSKMNTMVLPAICLAYELILRGRLRRRDALAVVPMLALAALVGWYNLHGNPIHGTSWPAGTRAATWLSSSVVFFRYLGNLALPTRLTPTYDVWLYDSLLDPAVALSLTGLAVLATATLGLALRRHAAAFWIVWFVLCLAPMLNVLVPGRSMMQDRFMYLAMLGPLALTAGVVAGLRSAVLRRAFAASAGIAIVACVVLSHRQVEVWHDPLTLWKPTALGFPFYAGDPGYTPEDYDAKVAFLREAVAAEPPDAVPYNNLGTLYFAVGKIEEARPLYETAARLAPDSPYLLANLANAYLRLNELDRAQHILEHAAEIAPTVFQPHQLLLRVYLLRGDAERARRELDTCVLLRPDPPSAWVWRNEQAYLERLEAARRAQGSAPP
jgi:protein O-mannosyl-transferase